MSAIPPSRTTEAITRSLPWLARHADAYRVVESGETHTTVPERLPHVDLDETITHISKEGETLLDIAVLYYNGQVENPADYWEIIAQFQEEPILDGSVGLRANLTILVPPLRYTQEVAFGDSLREMPVL